MQDEYPEHPHDQSIRPYPISVPDVSARAFRMDAHRQSFSVAAGAQAREDQAFIDNVSDWGVDASDETLDPKSALPSTDTITP